jgi:Reverse transcriptase (RNA-dependent DNA polymerase)
MKELVGLCRDLYEQGAWPEDFTRVVMIPLQKKMNAVECGDHRTISLISHASKIMLKVLTRRIEAKTKDFIGPNQFGFRRGCGTRDAIGVMRVLCERSLEHGNDVYICFVDFEKAFDRVNWVKMMDILKRLQVDWRDRRMINQLYMSQEAVIRIADGESEPAIIGRGVRQGCPLSPLLFSIYAEAMMMETLDGAEEGIRVGGELISDVRFADDQGMVANSERGLQRLMDRLNINAKKYDMKINAKKTKSMVVAKKVGAKVEIMVDGQRIEQVKKFKYLGSMITEDGRCIEDVKQRIGMAKEAFNKRRELMTKSMSRKIKKIMVKTLVWPVALYGCETWTMRKEEIDRLYAFEMWVWRRMERVSWKDKKTNEDVLQSVGEERSLLETVLKRKKNWIGHVLRGDGLLKCVIEGRMEGKRSRGRPRIGMLDELKEGSYANMKRRAEDRAKWRIWKPRTCHEAEN